MTAWDQTNERTSASDAALVSRAVHGCTDSFNQLVERHFGGAYSVAYSRVAVRETAEDLAQEAFLRAYLHLKNLKEPSRFAAWVCRIIRNIAADWKARACNRSALVASVPLEEIEEVVPSLDTDIRDNLSAGEEFARLTAAIERLPEELREVVLLHFGESMPKNQIADMLEVHPSTIGRRIDQALKSLRTELEPVLHRGAAPLRSRRSAVARSTAIIAAFAAMSAASKSALAAATATMAVTLMPSAEVATQTVAAAATTTATGTALPTSTATVSASGWSASLIPKVSLATWVQLFAVCAAVAYVLTPPRSHHVRAGNAPAPALIQPSKPPRIAAAARRESTIPAEHSGAPHEIQSLTGLTGESPAAAQRKTLIQGEIAAIGMHPWAGTYCSTDAYGAKCHLYVAPANGFVYESESKAGIESIDGNAFEDSGKLTVGHDNDTTQLRLLRRDKTLLPVHWGQRLYLISPQMMITFCSAVNSGYEPRTTPFGCRYLLREGDEKTTVTGRPEVPDNFKRYLLDNPALVAIASIDNVTTWTGDGGKGYYIQTMLTLHGGSDIGLDGGLKLYSYEPKEPQQMITIWNATETTSTASHICHSSKPTTPTVNWVFTTGAAPR